MDVTCLESRDRLRGDIKAIELGYQERSARTGPGLDLGDQIAVIRALLLVDVELRVGAAAPEDERRVVATLGARQDAVEAGDPRFGVADGQAAVRVPAGRSRGDG